MDCTKFFSCKKDSEGTFHCFGSFKTFIAANYIKGDVVYSSPCYVPEEVARYLIEKQLNKIKPYNRTCEAPLK